MVGGGTGGARGGSKEGPVKWLQVSGRESGLLHLFSCCFFVFIVQVPMKARKGY